MNRNIPRLIHSLLILLTAVTFTACSNTPIHDYRLEAPPQNANYLRLSREQPESKWGSLALNAASWRVGTLLANEDMQIGYINNLLATAEAETIALTIADFQQVNSHETAEQLVRDMADQIEEQHGMYERVAFDYDYFVTTAENLIMSGSSPYAEVDPSVISVVASQYLTAAISAAEQLGIPADILEDGQRLVAVFAETDAPDQHIGDLMVWKKSIWLAANGSPTPAPTPPPSDLAGIDINLVLPPGNSLRGELLMERNACYPCHIDLPIGPQWIPAKDEPLQPLTQRFEQNWKSARYTGKATSVEQYVIESILIPSASTVDGYAQGIMPTNFGSTLSRQDLADILAFLMAID